MTLDGTRTFLVGRDRVAIIDPGPDSAAHIDAVADHVGDGVVACILITHAHPDHADGVYAMAERFNAPFRNALRDGEHIATDAGDLVVVATPGHTPDHVAFVLDDIVFCGDLMMGGLDTALVAPPEGNLRQYLASLEKLRALNPRQIQPAHGPPFDDPQTAIAHYIEHRETRLQQVRDAVAQNTNVFDAVYGKNLDPRLRPYAEAALQAYIDYLND
jgi:glyoxylase-like metal-dependent hydrolase (beta-lactamase superfamily II)